MPKRRGPAAAHTHCVDSTPARTHTHKHCVECTRTHTHTSTCTRARPHRGMHTHTQTQRCILSLSMRPPPSSARAPRRNLIRFVGVRPYRPGLCIILCLRIVSLWNESPALSFSLSPSSISRSPSPSHSHSHSWPGHYPMSLYGICKGGGLPWAIE